jgi:hypothetical protein
VLEDWLRHERLNLDYRRVGITRYRMPPEYSTNQLATSSIQETGWYPSDAKDVHLGIERLAVAADCLGDQLRYLRDMKAAVRAVLLLDYLHTTYPEAGDFFWRMRLQGHLLPDVANRLNVDGKVGLVGLDALQSELDGLHRVAAAIESARSSTDTCSFVRNFDH